MTPNMYETSVGGIVVQRLAAFCDGDTGGNPAGVAICNELPNPAEMQAIAKEVGCSETAFAAPIGQDWHVRYFAPEIEVPFCGHATIALGAALAVRHGDGRFRLRLNDFHIAVEGSRTDVGLSATLHSPPTRSEPANVPLLTETLQLFNYRHEHLHPSLPPAVAEAGARHVIVALANRALLATMSYDLSAGRQVMLANGLATISLIHAAGPCLFHSRNAFAAGGVYEDPATGAAAAALAGYLRDRGWPHNGSIVIMQGEDMGVPSRLCAEISPEPGASIRVSGSVRIM